MTVRLLYVEDDDDLRRLFSLMLSQEGYEVVAVSNAEDAIMQLHTQHYDVLLTDYNLANKNADWMLQLAEAGGVLRATRVVVLTAEQHPQGIDGYRVLRKPVEIADLFAALDGAVAPHGPATVDATRHDSGDALKLTLYVTGDSRESKKAIRNLGRVVSDINRDRISVAVCDVTKDGLPAGSLDADRIVVTPTLVRSYPLPKVWLFGDLSKLEVVQEMITSGLEALSSRQ